MPQYVIERNVGQVSEAQLREAAIYSKQVREEQFPDVGWDRSYVVKTDAGLLTYCIYEAETPERVLEHARAANLPADAIREVVMVVDPAKL
jgi:hypothetical protein